MIAVLLIFHGLIGVSLIGAITHQATSTLRRANARSSSFVDRYTGVNQRAFTVPVVVFYMATVVLGAVIYPSYRLDVRIPFEQMSLGWAVGLFELKEHFGGIGLGVLPLYFYLWTSESKESTRRVRTTLTLLLAFIVWWNFLIGHVLNNIRGLG